MAWCLCLLLLLTGPAVGTEAPWLVTGDEGGLWLVRTNPSDNTFDLMSRPAGGRWKWVNTDLVGRPVAAVAAEGGLHLVFHSGQYRVFPSSGGEGTPGENLEQLPLALCAGVLGDSPTATVVAFVPHPQPATATVPAAPPPKGKPAKEQKTAASEQPVALEVMRNVGLKWQYLADLEIPSTGVAAGIEAAISDGALYVLVGKAPGRLLVWTGQGWQDVPLEAAKDSTVLGMVGMDDRLTVLTAAGHGWGGGPVSGEAEDALTSLAVGMRLAKDKAFSWQPVTENAKPPPWPAGQPPKVARLAQRVALVWTEGKGTKLAVLNPTTGQIDRREDVESLGQPEWDSLAQEAYNYFLLAVSFLILVSLFRTRRPVPYRSFSLPDNAAPGNLGKRLLAALVDLVPCNLVAGIIVHLALPPIMPEELNDLLSRIYREDQAPPYNVVAAGILMMLLYVPYCITMEKRYGATLGKMVFKLRVVADEGRPIDLREAMLRNLVKVWELSWLPLLPLLILVPLLSRYHQRLGDMLARTAVTDMLLAERSALPPLPPSGHDAPGRQDWQDQDPTDTPPPPPPQ